MVLPTVLLSCEYDLWKYTKIKQAILLYVPKPNYDVKLRYGGEWRLSITVLKQRTYESTVLNWISASKNLPNEYYIVLFNVK